jgi:hypothetical protein
MLRPENFRGAFIAGDASFLLFSRHFFPVDILSKNTFVPCAIHIAPVDDFSRSRACGVFFGELSSKSSDGRLARAQHKSFAAFATRCFPHFHSDGYYYYLYPYSETGYSSRSKPHICKRLPPEEIQQWNSV